LETSTEETLTYYQKWLRLLRENLVARGLKHGVTWLLELITRLVTGAPIHRYSRVATNLYMGGQYKKRGWPKLLEWGITAVVNMRSEYDDANAGIAPSHYLHLPTVDGTAPKLEHLRQGVDFIQHEIDGGGAVYVHCEAGVGRAVTMVAAYLVDKMGLTPFEAWSRLKVIRPFIRPTSSQVRRVERFAQGAAESLVEGDRSEEVAGRAAAADR
jgi:hypothetical protein